MSFSHALSLICSRKLLKLTLATIACFAGSTIDADEIRLNQKSVREQINKRSHSIQDAPDSEDFGFDWCHDLAEEEPPVAQPPQKPKPLHGDDDTFFPIDESEGRMPSSRLKGLIQSAIDGADLLPQENDKEWEPEPEPTPPPAPKKPEQLRRRPTDQAERLAPLSPVDDELIPTPAPTPQPAPRLANQPPLVNTATQVEQTPVPAALESTSTEKPLEEVDLYSPEDEPLREGYEDQIDERQQQTIMINFNNVSIVEFIRFASRMTGKNFIFDENELFFNVSIISEEPTSINNIMTALMQELRIHGLTMMEQGNNIIIYSNNAVNGISKVVDESGLSLDSDDSEIITQVFRLNSTSAAAAAAVIRPLTSNIAVIDIIDNSNHLIVTDITANVKKIGQLIRNLDSPKSGLVIGQYVVKNDYVDSLAENAKGIMAPLSGEQSLSFIPHPASNSIFIVGSPYLVEKSIQIMRYLDQNEGATRLLDQQGRWVLDDNGQWIFRSGAGGNAPPNGGWYIDEDGNWIFKPGEPGTGEQPDGAWELDENGNWIYKLKPGQTIAARKIERQQTDRAEGLPLGHIEKAQFTIYKLKYRKGDQVAEALRNIGETLQNNEALNLDFINSINTVQWIESSNSLIFTGTPMALQKVIEFIEEIDVPLRQVFIEMLIMDMTLTDALIYGVNWGTQLGGGSVALGESFVSGQSQINSFLTSAVPPSTPTVAGLATIPGYRLGVIGQHLTRGGIQFDNIAALVKATHQDEDTRILMNPKIFTEENYAAEVFVGLEVQYPTQSIANDFGNVITQNFESKDIGTKLRVTPIIGNNDVITIDIDQEVSNVAGLAVQVATQSSADAGPTITKSTTHTRVHVPNGFFVVISGEIRDEERRRRDQVPCLGAVPFLGAFFSEKDVSKSKRNLMIFMRPQIIDTEEQFDTLTKHQQNVWQNASYSKKSWEFEVDEALDLMNLKPTLIQRYDQCD